MRILLITRCGCQQWKEIPEQYPPPQYKIPLPRTVSAIKTNWYDCDVTASIEIRVFQYVDTSRYGNFHVYKEIE